MKYAVTAATGNFGKLAVSYLAKLVDQKEIVIVARDQQKAEKLFPGFEIRVGNYDEEASITAALEGINRVLFISSQPGGAVERKVQHEHVVSALKANHVDFVAYTSFAQAQTSKSELAQDHKATEEMIAKADIAHSFLRNNWYLENETGFFQSGQQAHKAIYWANNCAGWALEREYAEGAARVLTSENPNEIYEFAGPATTYSALGEGLNQALTVKSEISQVTKDEYIADLEDKGLDHPTAALYASFQDPIDNGSLNENTTDLASVLGRPLTDLSEGIKEILK